MLTTVDWSARVRIKWDDVDESNSTVAIDTLLPADPPTVKRRQALWRVMTTSPRVFAEPYQHNLNTSKANVALGERRGRGFIARDIREEIAFPPIGVLAWHLPKQFADPLLVTALAPATYPDAEQQVVIDQAVVLLLDALLYVAADRKRVVLARLGASSKEGRAVADALSVLNVDVSGHASLERYLTELLGDHVDVARRIPSGTTLLRIKP